MYLSVYFLCTRIILRNFASVIKIIVMRGKVKLTLMALVMMACSKEGLPAERNLNYEYGRNLSHEKIVLGERLENPYKTENITKALNSLYPTKADRVELESTDLYVRFLPENKEQCDTLVSMGLRLTDHPLDYDILVEGDWYHDPDVPEGDVTWQYAVVPIDFVFPDIRYEVIDECFLAENASTKAFEDLNWDEIERHSYILTGNEDKLVPDTKGPGDKSAPPKGRITILDEHYNDGIPIGVSGVLVSCNSFVKYDDCYTDSEGYYQMSKKFSSNIRYRIIFENELDFTIGLNMILFPASVSTLGKSSPSGVDMTVTKDSDDNLYKRCVVNNAAYDYISSCMSRSGLDIAAPPTDVNIWIFNTLRSSSAVMLHHGAVLENQSIKNYLGEYSSLLRFFLPDITIGAKGTDEYREIYSSTCHELAHASHFARVGKIYWDAYIRFIIESYITSGGITYGDGTEENAGYCEVGEMWAYFVESLMFKNRYGGNFPTFGNSHWFKPEIFRYLYARGLTCSSIFSVLDENVISKKSLERALIAEYPHKKSMIEMAFDKY